MAYAFIHDWVTEGAPRPIPRDGFGAVRAGQRQAAPVAVARLPRAMPLSRAPSTIGQPEEGSWGPAVSKGNGAPSTYRKEMGPTASQQPGPPGPPRRELGPADLLTPAPGDNPPLIGVSWTGNETPGDPTNQGGAVRRTGSMLDRGGSSGPGRASAGPVPSLGPASSYAPAPSYPPNAAVRRTGSMLDRGGSSGPGRASAGPVPSLGPASSYAPAPPYPPNAAVRRTGSMLDRGGSSGPGRASAGPVPSLGPASSYAPAPSYTPSSQPPSFRFEQKRPVYDGAVQRPERTRPVFYDPRPLAAPMTTQVVQIDQSSYPQPVASEGAATVDTFDRGAWVASSQADLSAPPVSTPSVPWWALAAVALGVAVVVRTVSERKKAS